MEEIIQKLNQLSVEEIMNAPQAVVKAVRKATKPLIGSKSSVPFSSATFSDCSRIDGLNLKVDYLSLDEPTIHIPSTYPSPQASSALCEQLSRIKSVWVLNNKASCRIVIDAILTEVLCSDVNPNLIGFCEVSNDWEGEGVIYTGDVDYMLGTSKIIFAEAIDSFLMVVEAKKEWPDKSVAQVLCEAGCLLKNRLAAGKNTPVLAVLTNGRLFRFFAIDTDGTVYASDEEILKIGNDGSYASSSSLKDILRWFYWFMESVKSISPRASSEELSDAAVKESIAEFRKCFGPRNVSKKRLKTDV
jgi:hypothetical protein